MDCYIPEEGAYAISARICGRIQHVGLAATWALYGRMARDPWSQQRVSTSGTPCRDVAASSRASRSPCCPLLRTPFGLASLAGHRGASAGVVEGDDEIGRASGGEKVGHDVLSSV